MTDFAMEDVPEYVRSACERMTRKNKDGHTFRPLFEGSRGWRAREYDAAGLCIASRPI
jgi:hypothetical protein